MQKLPKVILKSGKDQSVRRYHPWIFSGAIKKIHGSPKEGDWVEVYDNKDEYLACGHYQNSSIAVRILDFNSVENKEDFYVKKIQNAFGLRKEIGLIQREDTSIFRMINAEGDGLPGLIADYYGGDLVLQMHSAGIYKDLDIILSGIKKQEGDFIQRIYNKSSSSLPFKSGIKSEDKLICGDQGQGVSRALEYGNTFQVDILKGQKTGFFIDQRENRKLLGAYSNGKKVLNMFGYTGGFSVYALSEEADLVHTVDASKKATDLTDINVALNFSDVSRHKSFAMDAFDFFESGKEEYDVIILDPPAFAKHHNVLGNALQGYKKINRKAIEKIKPGGIIFTFSCSQVVSKENFKKSVFTAAANTGREVKILHHLTQPADHPVSIYHPEGEYLKGLVLKVF